MDLEECAEKPGFRDNGASGDAPARYLLSVVDLDEPAVHLLRPIVVVTYILEEMGVLAETIGVVGVGLYGPLVHLLHPIIITTHVLEEEGVVTEIDNLVGVGFDGPHPVPQRPASFRP